MNVGVVGGKTRARSCASADLPEPEAPAIPMSMVGGLSVTGLGERSVSGGLDAEVSSALTSIRGSSGGSSFGAGISALAASCSAIVSAGSVGGKRTSAGAAPGLAPFTVFSAEELAAGTLRVVFKRSVVDFRVLGGKGEVPTRGDLTGVLDRFRGAPISSSNKLGIFCG